MKTKLSVSAVVFGIVALFAFALTGLFATSVFAGGYLDISAVEAKALIEKTPGLVILDVSPAYAKGHLPGAINHPVGDGSLDQALPSLDKGKTYLVYCHADAPSIAGAQKLVDAGVKKVYRLVGNYKGWVDAGFAVEK